MEFGWVFLAFYVYVTRVWKSASLSLNSLTRSSVLYDVYNGMLSQSTWAK